MLSNPLNLLFILLSTYVASTSASYCDSPSPAFPPLDLSASSHSSRLEPVLDTISASLSEIVSKPRYDTTHLSFSITSATNSIFDFHHTAKERSSLHRGAEAITNTTCYRIASITKPFTVLALFKLHEAGLLTLDSSILEYLPALDTTGAGKSKHGMPWKDITIRSLAGQMAGVPRDLAQGDLIASAKMAAKLGLPKLDSFDDGKDKLELPKCDGMANYTRACNASDLLDWVAQKPPLFAPNQQSSYSNIAFDLLGLVIANVSGQSFEDYVTERILEKVGMDSGTSFTTPSDSQAAIAKDIEYYWPFELGVQNPTGGLYTNTHDMDKWLRYVLSTFNAHANGSVNWFQPAAWSGSLNTFYALPWEVLRLKTSDVIKGGSSRPLTFVTKGGGLPGYTSEVIMVPEYNIGVTILVAGNGSLLADVKETVVKGLVDLAEQVSIEELKSKYSGTFADASGNLTLELAVSVEDGLHVKSWISNGVDVKSGIADVFAAPDDTLILNVVPTLLYVDQEKQAGEKWRFIPTARRSKSDHHLSMFNNFCVSNIDIEMYVGRPLNEVVFFIDENKSDGTKVQLPAYRKTLTSTKKHSHTKETPDQRLVAQS